jgi:hypothetical protein
MAGDVTATLRGYAKDAMAIIGGGGGRAYNPDDDQEDGCPFLEADASELLDTPLLEVLRRGASLPQVGPDDVRRRQVALYAVLIGNDPDSRLTFVRKGSPVQLARRGLVAVLDSSLTRVMRPILAFDPVFDVVIHDTKVWILGQKRFEGLFRESAAVLAMAPEWAQRVSEAVPLSGGSREYLTERMQQNSVLRRKVHSILRCSYLGTLTPDTLAKGMAAHGLDRGKLMPDGTLIINKETEQDVLFLLNEDLWTGDFSGDSYAASRKARRLDVVPGCMPGRRHRGNWRRSAAPVPERSRALAIWRSGTTT